MPWRRAATVIVDAEGAFLDADEAALELLGVGSVEALRAMAPDCFAPVPPDQEEEAALRRAYFATPAGGLLAELTFRRLDGELIRTRVAVIDEGDDRFRILFHVVERPTRNLVPRVYRIADVIAEWRSAERRLAEVDPASAEAAQLLEDIELLRTQRQVMFRRVEGRARSSFSTKQLSVEDLDTLLSRQPNGDDS